MLFTLQLVLRQNHWRHRAARESSLYFAAGSINRVTGALEQLKCLQAEAPYSCSCSLDRDTRDIEQPGPLRHAEAPYSQAGSLDRDTRDMEQLEY